MKTKGFATIVASAAVAVALPAFAHHSISMIEISTPIWVRGTVAEFRAINPHVLFTMEGIGPDGQTQRWTIEGPNLARLARMHADETFLKPGDAVEVCGFALKKSVLSTQKNFVHGHMLVMPDGHRRLFGPYGKLDNCFLPGDATAPWVAFLSTDPLGLQAWCGGLTYTRVPTVAPPEWVAGINRELKEPCH